MTFITYSNAVRMSEDELCLKMPSEFVKELQPDLYGCLYDTDKVRAWLNHYADAHPKITRLPPPILVRRKYRVERTRKHEQDWRDAT